MARASRRVVFVDTETWRIVPGRQSPDLVCGQFSDLEGGAAELLTAGDACDRFLELLEDPRCEIVAHNMAFDARVMLQADPQLSAPLWHAMARGRMRCTLIREQLRKIALGRMQHDPAYRGGPPKFRLEDLVREHLGEDLEGKGDDGPRTRYHEVDGLPLSRWPQAFVDYATADADYPRRVWRSQCYDATEEDGVHYADEAWKTRQAFALGLASAWGMRTDPGRVRALKAHRFERVRDVFGHLAATTDLIIGRTKKQAPIRARVIADHEAREAEAWDLAEERDEDPQRYLPPSLPRTKGGAVSIKREVLEESHDPDLQLLATALQADYELSNFLPMLERGTVAPIHARFRFVATGRTGSSPNVQNLARRLGVRECFEPRPGHVFGAADLSGAELVALGQICLDMFGRSSIADRLNAGIDLHSDMGAQIWGVSYAEQVRRLEAGDPEAKNYRSTGKAANFGLPGGLTEPSFKAFARTTYGVELSLARAGEIRRLWQHQHPEIVDKGGYFDTVGRWCGSYGGKFTYSHPHSGRVRGGVGYTNGCNGPFQGLVADAALRALFHVSRECYTGSMTCDTCLGIGWVYPYDPYPPPGRQGKRCRECHGAGVTAGEVSPLFGSRVVNFVHDEILAEHPIAKAAAAVERLAVIMARELRALCPDLARAVKAEPTLMSVWSKAAKPVRDTRGVLIPWAPDWLAEGPQGFAKALEAEG